MHDMTKHARTRIARAKENGWRVPAGDRVLALPDWLYSLLAVVIGVVIGVVIVLSGALG